MTASEAIRALCAAWERGTPTPLPTCSARTGFTKIRIISLGAAPCRDQSRDGAGANRPPESFINGLVFTLKGLTLAR